MGKKILIDLTKCRNCAVCTTECVYDFHPNNNGVNTLRELAVFNTTCRRCEEAPCISSCPTEALEREEDGLIRRGSNLCIGCKSCVVACPFGALMDDFFDFKKSICNYCNLSDETKELKCIETCPEDAISLVDMEENVDENIYKINDKLLIKDYSWEKLQKKG